MVFTDTARAEPALMLSRFEALAQRAQARSVLLTLRDYTLATRARWALAERLRDLAERTQQGFGVADRADLARALGAHALHLPGTGFCASEARHYLGPEVFVSRGSHDPDDAPEPELDARLLSPIFAERKRRPALGVRAIERARHATPMLLALGGVQAHNAAACLAAGAAGVAVIGAALALDPEPLLGALGILRG
jgi:thiamine-phosphate pyrophosphorylase